MIMPIGRNHTCNTCDGTRRIETKPGVSCYCPDCCVAINIRSIPPSLRRDFKSWCAKNDVSMGEAIITFMEAATRGDLKLEDAI